MPFKSEKQRRFLWAEHPEIAKRWAHEYPKSNKNLPMYAHEDTQPKSEEKAAQSPVFNPFSQVEANRTNSIVSILAPESTEICKESDSKQEQVDIPHSSKPVYAGEEREKGIISTDVSNSTDNCAEKPKNAINTLLQKLSVVLSPAIEQTMENMNAENEGRVPRRVSKNQNLKQYPQATPQIPLPMGMQQPAPAQQPQQAQQKQPASTTPVGAGQSSATTDPIKFHSGLSASGIINGNAALSAPNTVNTKISRAGDEIQGILMGIEHVEPADIGELLAEERMKSAIEKWAGTPAWQRAAGKNDEGGLNAKGRASYNRETGGNLKAPVTEKNPKGERNKRQNSFCSRMCGMKRVNTGAKTKSDPDSRINKALRKWNCKCGSEKTAIEFPLWNYTLQHGLDSNNTPYLALPTGLGALAGGAYGAYSAPKGKKLKHGLVGAGIGGALGLGGTVVGDALIAPGAKIAPKITGTDRKLHNARKVLQEANDHNAALAATRPKSTVPPSSSLPLYDNSLRYDHPHNQAAHAAYREWLAATNKHDAAVREWEQKVDPMFRKAWELVDDVDAARAANENSMHTGATAGYYGGTAAAAGLGALGLHQLAKHREKKKKPEKQAQDFDPAMSRDAENAIMHGTGLVGSAALGTVAGLPVSAGLEQFAKARNWIPSSEKSPFGHNLANSLLKIPMFVGGTLGLSLYDNYILRPHMKRELERKKQEEEVRQQLAIQKQAEASLGRILGTALASTGGGLLVGGYPGWKLQRASEAAGNNDFTNFLAGKAPIALAGALSGAAFNHLYDKYEQPKKKREPENPSLKYLQYLVH